MSDKQPTQKQIVEFWEWCGFLRQTLPELPPKHRHEANLGWWIPRSEEATKGLPPIDLISLFTFAVPKVSEQIIYPLRELLAKWTFVVETKDDDPALALFWTIWQVMQEVKDG